MIAIFWYAFITFLVFCAAGDRGAKDRYLLVLVWPIVLLVKVVELIVEDWSAAEDQSQ